MFFVRFENLLCSVLTVLILTKSDRSAICIKLKLQTHSLHFIGSAYLGDS